MNYPSLTSTKFYLKKIQWTIFNFTISNEIRISAVLYFQDNWLRSASANSSTLRKRVEGNVDL